MAGAAVALLATCAPAQAAQRDETISSFDGTSIVLSFFPADNLGPGQKAPVILYGPGWSQTRPQDNSTSSDVEGAFGALGVRTLRAAGYNVLTWDPRGFGDSGGTVTVDAPDREGRDVQALLDYAARQPEVALDAPGDPRAGMSGASYGGGIQLVVAAIDNRLDAIVPDIAWHSLVTSLYKDRTVKAGWGSVLTGAAAPASRMRTDPHINSAFQEGAATGRFSDENVRWFASRGPGSLVDRIRIPTFFTQGTVDTLFTLDEAAVNYATLRRNGIPTKLMWFCGGHGTCLTPGGDPAHLRDAVLAWLKRWLRRDRATATGPRFEWIDQRGAWHAASDFPLAPGAPLTAAGNGVHVLSTGPGEGGAVASTRAANAVNVAIPPPAADTHLVGAPRLSLAYSGTAASADARLYAQIVDEETGIVLGNQVTPLPVTLDGAPHTLNRPLEMVSALLHPGQRLTLQLFSASSVYDLGRTPGTLSLSTVNLSLPTADPAKAPPGYPGSAAARARHRAGLRLGPVAGLSARRLRALLVRVTASGGVVRNVVVTVRGRRGRVEGRSRPRSFGGTRRVVVRLRRVLPAGRYRIEAVGRRADGTTVRAVRTVRRPPRRSARSAGRS
ncbi:MAG: type transport system ATP-binding protein [Solirubrobacteraceae bacterium]|nr:type transport system ATP-binding protein [Solirubrobacteraceae bacterium]